MKIRLATVEDAGILAMLNQDVQRLHADALPSLFKQPGDLTDVTRDFAERLLPDPNGRTFIAEVEGEAAGYISAIITERADNPYTFAYRYVYIDQISVRPIFRKQGCGKALMQTVFDLARSEKIDHITLGTLAFNTEAHQFFQRMGFEFFSYRMDTHFAKEAEAL